MKRKVISIIGVTLFFGVMTYNLQLSLSSNNNSDMVLIELKKATASDIEDCNGPTDCPEGHTFDKNIWGTLKCCCCNEEGDVTGHYAC